MKTEAPPATDNQGRRSDEPPVGNLEISSSSSVLSSAFNHLHPSLPVTEVGDDTHVKIAMPSGRDLECTAKQASEAGFLVRNSDGTYRDIYVEDIDDISQARAERLEATPPTIDNSRLDVAPNQQFFGALENSLSATGSQLQPLISSMLTTSDSIPSALHKAAQHAGVDAAEAHRELGRILDDYAARSFDALVSFNVIDAEQAGGFLEWLNRPENTSAALSASMETIWSGRLSVLTALAKTFTQENRRDIAQQNAGQQR
jgi:hypothetical protein